MVCKDHSIKVLVYSDLAEGWGDDLNPALPSIAHTIHVWYIYLHLPYFTIKNNQM